MPPVSKITLTDGPKVFDFNEIIGLFSVGKIYIGNGSYADAAAADAAFADLTEMATELDANYDELSDLAEKPGKESSKVEKYKTLHHTLEGKRTNTIELNLEGLSQERKDWLEDELNKEERTLVLVSFNGKDALVFNGLRWSYERDAELNSGFAMTISAEYSGSSKLKYRLYKDIPEAAV